MLVGLAGVGMLGAAAGRRLLECGIKIMVYNRTASKTDALRRLGASVADEPSGLAGCDLIITCVKDADALRDILFGSDGLADAGAKPVICDMSTIDPAASRDISGRLEKCGIIFLDVPVMGGPNVAIRGKLVMMASGQRDAFTKYEGTLRLLAEKIFYLGAPGTAHSVKLAMNLQIAMLAASLSEGIALSRASGVDPETFLEILNSTYFGTGMSRIKAHKMVKGIFEPTFLLRNLNKDLRTINASARSLGINLPMSEMAEDLYTKAERAGFGELDYTGILGYIEKTARS